MFNTSAPFQPPPFHSMESSNQTAEFILLGLSDHQQRSQGMFFLFLFFYIITVIGNLIIMVLIRCDPDLDTPMYFFIANLSFVDVCFTTVTVPRLLANFLMTTRSISFMECFTQMYFFVALGITESFLLAVMAYDRLVAIRKPLHYVEVMNRRVCLVLVAGSWITACLHSLLHSVTISRLSYCADNHIHHFFCDMTALLKLTCSDTYINELLIFTEGSLIIISPFLFIVASYVLIVYSILRLYSGEGRWRTFSTCSSHLTVVTLFYGTIIFIYFRPTSSYSPEYDRIISVLYSIITPMLNPFIYSLRNKEVRAALRKATKIIYSKNNV